MSRLKLNKTDFENHIFRPRGEEPSTTLVSRNGKVGVLLSMPCVGTVEPVIEGTLNKVYRVISDLYGGNAFLPPKEGKMDK